MEFALLQAGICCAGALIMAFYVLGHPHKARLHWMWLGVLGGIALWNAGGLVRHLAPPEFMGGAVEMVLNGVLLTSAFWLLAAHAHAQPQGSPWLGPLVWLVACVTAALTGIVATNDVHGLVFQRQPGIPELEAGPHAYAAGGFWWILSWSYLCTTGAAVFYLRGAVSLLRRDSRQRGLLLAVASVVPIAMSTAYVFQLIPVRHDLTPSGLIVSVVLLYLAVSRFHLLESLPVARSVAVQHLDDGVLMASPDGLITEWNAAAEAIFSDAPLRVGARLEEQLARLGGGEPGARHIEVTCATVGAESGTPTGQFAILADRTEAEHLERLARQNQRLEIVGALAAGFAHEINDPLTYVNANLVEIERLGRRVEDEGNGPDAELAAELVDLRVMANESLEGLARIRHITEEMRGLSREGRDDFALLDLVEVAQTALRLARLCPSTGGPRVELALEAVDPVRGREGRLVQLVLNLLVNARQALVGRDDARIVVETRSFGRTVELTVRDNGPGIPEALRDRVFDPFFTTRAPESGTGLGLAIAFDIAREHGGSLETRSEPGGGACFALRIPAGLSEAVRASGAVREAAEGAGAGR